MAPLVSILTPLYKTNHSHLRAMIESVLNQDYQNFEFILLNDSPDDLSIEQVVREYKDKRIKYITNPINQGIAKSRNRLIQESKGEYLAILDHDDICFPDRLTNQVAYLQANLEVGVVSGLIELMSTGKIQGNRYPKENLEIKQRLLRENCIAHSAMMIRKNCLVDNGITYKALFSPAEDYHLCIDLMAVTLFHNLEKPLIKYRDNHENTTYLKSDLMEDRKRVIASQAQRDFGFYDWRRKRDLLLFGFVKIGTIRKTHKGSLFLLFGFIPLLLIR